MKRVAKDDAIEIGKRIKKLRETKRMTQDELAKLVKKGGRSTINSWEKGMSQPRAAALLVMADFFNVSVDYILFGNEDMTKVNFTDTVSIPLYSSISCGDLSSIDNELLEYVEVPGMLKQRFGDKLFAIVAKGDSMDKKVPDGHIAVFAQGVQWENGDAVAVIVNGEEATMKNITKLQTSIVLEPDSNNPEHSPIMIDCNKVSCDEYVKVIGRLVFMYKDF